MGNGFSVHFGGRGFLYWVPAAFTHLPASELQNHRETQDEMKLSLTVCLIHFAAI